MRTILTAALITTASFVVGTSAHAQIEGATRLHLDTPVLNFNHSNFSVDDVDESLSATSFGVNLGVPSFTLGIGYGLSEQLVLGTSVLFNHGSISLLDDSLNATVLAISPYLNYVMGGANDRVRPFVGAAINFTFARSGDSATDASTSFWAVGGGPQGGMHIFLAEALSLDLTGRILALYGSGDLPLDDIGNPSGNVFSFDVTGFIGISGWL